ncbi:spore coat associated protein CotJA [Paenibacillus eucommiae]|uniref:Spore coat protein JA n=1 Tax=Paenibacillus eucommiae TaxID=1355755 RepID=A0ABS4J7S0_9BACL|nr:spore coat associated protein CotJA [Paenibacillus eucommiae]MBP1995899.1 spore coat protein JA [Paenibacillus eucommiae]
MYKQVRVYFPYVSPCDPCPPIREKAYLVPPQLFMSFQPPGLPQFSPYEALKRGTLWPALFSPYESRMLEGRPSHE